MAELTDFERSTMRSILDAVRENMVWDDEEKEYREQYEDWILALDKEEMKALNRILNKI